MEKACSSLNGYKCSSKSSTFKNPAVTALQDLLFYQLTGIAFLAVSILSFKKKDNELNSKLSRFLYLTNKGINFSINAMVSAIDEVYNLKLRLENLYRFLCKNSAKRIKKFPLSAALRPGDSLAQLVSQANIINIKRTIKNFNFNVYSLKEIIRFSLTSSANYLEHIRNNDNIPESIYKSCYEILEVLGNENISLADCKNTVLKAGEFQTQILELLISTFEKKYGFVEKKKVTTSFKKGSAILVTGEDFSFLKNLLKETESKDINIYTYGVLNYAHVFPEINKYKNLAGIYLGKYNNFSSDIENFPGVVVLTAGNLEELREIFRGRIFSTEDISMLGITKIEKDNLKPLINAAYDAPGFVSDKENCYIELGFGINELENKAQELYSLLSENTVQNIEIFIGCNNFEVNNAYMKKTINNLPSASAVIILDSLLFPFEIKNKKIPFILNFAQFINLYSLIRLIYSVSGKFRKDVNDMPIKFTVNLRTPDSVASLLVLMSLGIKDIQITSELPNYLTDSIINNFSKKFNIHKINYIVNESKTKMNGTI